MADSSTPQPPKVHNCCLKAFEWDGTPSGTETTIPGTSQPAYVVTGSGSTNPDAGPAILMVHDLFGWTFPNNRLLADHYAREMGAAVYLPDFFVGEVVPFEPLLAGRFEELDLAGWLARNGRAVREPEIFTYARALRGKHTRLGAVGFCYGGWAVFRLGAASSKVEDVEGEGGDRSLVDAISAGHPSMLTKEDIEGLAVPMQMLAPEIDEAYSPELKAFTFTTLQRAGQAPWEYLHFPGAEHGCLARGDALKKGEREAMVRGKNAVVAWMSQHLF
ncbi:Alpha/Beta hydrolase protein [Cercophora scortea]|uniref:Alpha/Beta hydrolase protein n=1 Tax=Cercophora scortea TaxID=314031 RepID=A0AAE0IN94_9PEZI|nr:Alpha/Beta hydrolase protein [Cercophora scortea]